MLLIKIKRVVTTLPFLLASLLLIVATFFSYNSSPANVHTYTNMQTKAVLADDLFNTCHTTCPTEQQSIDKRLASLPMFAVVRTGSTPPVGAALVPQQAVTFTVVLATILYVALYTSSRKKCALHSLWRN